jgi:hypothetical protein
VAPTGTGEEYAPGSGDGRAVAITRAVSGRRTVAVLRRDEIELGSGIQGMAQGAGVFALPTGVLTDEATRTEGTTTITHVRVGTVRIVNGRRIVRLEL